MTTKPNYGEVDRVCKEFCHIPVSKKNTSEPDTIKFLA